MNYIFFKKHIFFLVIGIFLSINSFSQDSICVCPKPSYYKVLSIKQSSRKINKTKKMYFVLLQNIESKKKFLIITKKNHTSRYRKSSEYGSILSQEKIQIGSIYRMALHKYYSIDSDVVMEVITNIIVDGVKVEIPVGELTFNIYITFNLVDLYYRNTFL